MAAREQVGELPVVERLGQDDPRILRQLGRQRRPDERVAVLRQHDMQCWMPRHELAHRTGRRGDPALPRLPPMARDEQDRLARRNRRVIRSSSNGVSRCTTSSSASMTVLPVTTIRSAGTPSREQVRLGRGRRGEVQRGELAGELAIALLGERRVQVAGSQPGLEVDHRDARVVRGDRSHRRARRVALHHHRVRRRPRNSVIQPGEDARGRSLSPPERPMRSRSKSPAMPNRSLTWSSIAAVLAGQHDLHVEIGRSLHGRDQRSHLDRLGAGAVDRHDAGHALASGQGLPAYRTRRRRGHRSRLLWTRGYRPLSPLPAGDVRRADRPVAGDRSAAHGPAHRPGEPRLSVQRTARMRQDDVGPHPGPLPQLRRGPDRHPVRQVPDAASSSAATAAVRSMSSRSTPRATTASTTPATCASAPCSRRPATATRSSSSTRRTW